MSGERGQACCTKQKCSTKHPAYPHDSHNSGEHVHCISALYMRSLLQNLALSINLQKDLCLKARSVGKGAAHINLNPNKQWALLKCNPRSPGLCFCPATSRSVSQCLCAVSPTMHIQTFTSTSGRFANMSMCSSPQKTACTTHLFPQMVCH